MSFNFFNVSNIFNFLLKTFLDKQRTLTIDESIIRNNKEILSAKNKTFRHSSLTHSDASNLRNKNFSISITNLETPTPTTSVVSVTEFSSLHSKVTLTSLKTSQHHLSSSPFAHFLCTTPHLLKSTTAAKSSPHQKKMTVKEAKKVLFINLIV